MNVYGARASAIQVEPPDSAYHLEIRAPNSEQTFQNDAQSIIVNIAVSPDLKAGDVIGVYVDGALINAPSAQTSISLPWLARGSHTIQARLTLGSGKIIESETITIYQQRPSVLIPKR